MAASNSFPAQVARFVAAQQLLPPAKPVLLAVSGGADSMVLLQVFHQLGYRFAVAHCNFQLRSNASDNDEALVTGYCKDRNITCHTIRFDTTAYAAMHKQSIEEAARNLRYDWFRQLCTEQNYHSIATAHHADDSIETAFMNFCKGTGISGLHGILPNANQVIRPLLFASKAELLAYARDNNIPFHEDASNQSADYTRNYFRLEVLPAIEKTIPGFRKNMLANIRRFSEQEWLYLQQIDMLKKKLVEQRGAEWFIPVLKLKQYPVAETLLFEVLKPFGFTPAQSAEAAKLADAPTGKWMVSDTHRLLKNRNFLIISTLITTAAEMVVIESGNQTITFAEGQLQLQTVKEANLNEANANTIFVDAAALTFPLILRKKKEGDYFYPIGMNHKKKKLARFLIDQKASLVQKERVWVLESDKRIVWVTGMRADERFKLTPHTRQIVCITLVPG